MAYQSPSGAFSNGLEDFMMKRAAAERQSMLDQRAYEYQQAELKQKDEALKRQREEADQRNEDRKLSAFEKRRGDLVAGDIPDDQLLKDADSMGQGHLFPVDDQTGHRVYMGAPKEREAKKQQDKIQGIIDQLGTVEPGSPDFTRLATEYEMRSGKQLPASLTKQPAGNTIPVIRTNPNKQVVERLVDGQWVPVTGDVPEHSHFMAEPPPKDTSAADARKQAQFNAVHQNAVSEIDKWAQPLDTHISGANDLLQLLDTKTPVTDRLVSPLVLKTVVAGQGTGFRMTRAEIDNITHGRSRWESLDLALKQWAADPSKALSMSETQRDDLRAMAKEIRKRAVSARQKTIDARNKVDSAIETSDIGAVNSARTELDKLLHVPDIEESNAAVAPPVLSAEEVIKAIRSGKKAGQ